MQLIGMLDSPYVRRVAISLRVLGLEFEHRPLSVFRTYDQFAAVNPAVKAPTLVTDSGVVLMDSTLILDHLENVAGRSLMPSDAAGRLRALRLLGLALAATEKSVQVVYENLRAPEAVDQRWLARVKSQLLAAYDELEREIAPASGWLVEDRMLQPDITVAVAWRFTQHAAADVVGDRYPALAAFSRRLEAEPAFVATPLD
jgi:glutathione S-transferase